MLDYCEQYLDLKKLGDLVLLVKSCPLHIPVIMKMIRLILSNPVTRNNMMNALELATDISRLRYLKKTLEDTIANLSQTKNILIEEIQQTRTMNLY